MQTDKDTNWSLFGLCVSHPTLLPDAWGEPGQGHEYGEVGASKKAKLVCGQCPVQADCLSYIMEAEGGKNLIKRFGIWGGLTPRERHARYRRSVRKLGPVQDEEKKEARGVHSTAESVL